MKYLTAPIVCLLITPVILPATSDQSGNYVVVDTGQDHTYNNTSEIKAPRQGQAFFGQDAQYVGTQAAYRDNDDGTVTDLNTGLTWSQGVDAEKLSLVEAKSQASRLKLAGYTDWRVPTIKELYSLMDFRGVTGMARPESQTAPADAVPYINTDYFDFLYGDVDSGERYIDAQWLTSTKYVSTTMGGSETLFGVNFADGRIKGYGYEMPGRRSEKKFYVRYVRGEPYGENDFVDNGDGTVTDRATGLTWMQADSGQGMNWEEALQYANDLELAGYDDWRLPNAKELQSIVDYSRSPDTTQSPAIDPLFDTTSIENEAGEKDWPFFWTSTTHLDGRNASMAAYIAFGRGIGQMHGRTMDVHGAGAQRSDPKTGSPAIGHGPQGDAQRVDNYVRCVRGGAELVVSPKEIQTNSSKYPNTVRVGTNTYQPEEIDMSRRPRMGPPSQRNTEGGMQRMALPAGPEAFIRNEDRNGDGKVSRREFRGPDNYFRRIDKNHDGYISLDEAPELPPGRQER